MKNCAIIFMVEELSSVQKSNYVKSKSKTTKVKPDNFV